MPRLDRYLTIDFWLLVAIFTLVGCSAATHAAILADIAALLLAPLFFFQRGAKRTAFSDPLIALNWLGVAIMAIVFIVNARSFDEWLLLGNFAPFLLATVVYLMARKLAGEKAVLIFATLCLAGAVIGVLFGLYKVFGAGAERAQGIFTVPVTFARMCVLFGFLAPIGALYARGKTKLLFHLGPVLAICGAVLSETRGVLIIVPLLLIFYLIWLGRSGQIPGVKRYWPALTALVVIGGIGATQIVDMNRFAKLADGAAAILTPLEDQTIAGDASLTERLAFYRAGIELIIDQPLTGYGWHSFKHIVTTKLDMSQYGPQHSRYFHFHNDILNFGVAGGVIGIAAWFMFSIAPLAGLLVAPRDGFAATRLYAIGVLFTLNAISGLTDISFGLDMGTTAYAFSGALILGLMRDEKLVLPWAKAA